MQLFSRHYLCVYLLYKLGLKKPMYSALSAYGHMGREELGVSWEKTDKTEELKKQINA